MIELPTLFNKIDFFGTLLPGYIAIILSLLLFKPELILNQEEAVTFDLFSAVVFLVAGPAAGSIIQMFHRYLFYSVGSIFRRDQLVRKRVIETYASVMLKAKAEEKFELAKSEASYDFCVSTGIILTLIGIYYSISRDGLQIITIPLLIISIILFVGAHFIRKEKYTPLYSKLAKDYPSG